MGDFFCVFILLISWIFLYGVAAMSLFIALSLIIFTYYLFNPLISKASFMVLIAYSLVLYVSFAQFFYSVPELEFIRIGHLTPTSVNLHFRLLKSANLQCNALRAKAINLKLNPDKSNDYVLFHELRIEPSEYYVCRVYQDDVIKFIAKFKTPSDERGLFRISFGSCTKFNFPFGNNEISGFKTILQHQPDILIFLGDFIYSDSPMIDPGVSDYESFAKLYRQTINFPETKAIFSTISSYFVFDGILSFHVDHEIRNDWHKGIEEPYPEAIKANINYVSGTNPSELNYFNFSRHNAGFYVLDTRTYRSDNTMLGKVQIDHLYSWLDYAKAHYDFIFICSSVPFTANFDINKADTFANPNFNIERQSLYDHINGHQVIILSGDRHEFGAVKLAKNIFEFSVSPMHQFYIPFYKFVSVDPILSYTEYGNNKVGIFDIDTVKGEAHFQVFINNKLFYNLTIQSKSNK